MSDITVSGIPKRIIQLIRTLAAFVKIIFAVGTTLVDLVYLPVMETTNCLPVFVLDSGPKISMATN